MELMLVAVLSGPLILVPLGAAVLGGFRPQATKADQGERRRPATRSGWGRGLAVGAACAVLAAVLPIGRLAGAAAVGWLLATAHRFVIEVVRWWGNDREVVGLPALVAWGWLPVAAGWFTASRAGVAPLGFGEPITLLTAAHFHVAGFGLSVLAGATAHRLRGRGAGRLAWVAWLLVTTGPILVATGFTIDEPTLNMVGAFVVAGGVYLLSACLVMVAGPWPRPARTCARIAAVVPLVPMVLAVAYSLGPVLGTPAPSIELMVRAHGIVNALGFVGLGLAAFVLVHRRDRPATPDPQEVVHALPA